jgi:hypothetical protein
LGATKSKVWLPFTIIFLLRIQPIRRYFIEEANIMYRMRVLAKMGASSRCPSHVYLVIALLILSCLPLTAEKKAGIWSPAEVVPGPDLHPQELLKLAEDFRTLRRRGSGIPDYDALIQKQKDQLPAFRSRLEAIDPSSWEMHFKIDYLLLRAEMDALEFDLYVWRQTERNPSLYVDAAIGNVERLLTGGRRMGDNPVLMPYKKDHALKILQALADTEEYLSQAKKHLTGFAPELADIALRHPGAGYYTSPPRRQKSLCQQPPRQPNTCWNSVAGWKTTATR